MINKSCLIKTSIAGMENMEVLQSKLLLMVHLLMC